MGIRRKRSGRPSIGSARLVRSDLVRSWRFRFGFERLERRDLLAFEPLLLGDINLGGASSLPARFTAHDDWAFFSADGALWKTDGTEAGTVKIKDVIIRTVQFPEGPRTITSSGEFVYFVAQSTPGDELWRSDGTAEGTVPIRSVQMPTSVSITQLTDVNGTLFFAAQGNVDGFLGRELFKTDGTDAGTVMVKDIYPGGVSSEPTNLTNVNGVLFLARPTIRQATNYGEVTVQRTALYALRTSLVD